MTSEKLRKDGGCGGGSRPEEQQAICNSDNNEFWCRVFLCFLVVFVGIMTTR